VLLLSAIKVILRAPGPSRAHCCLLQTRRSGSLCPLAHLHLDPDTTMPASHHSVFLQAGCPSCRPTNSVNALIIVTKLQTCIFRMSITLRKHSTRIFLTPLNRSLTVPLFLVVCFVRLLWQSVNRYLFILMNSLELLLVRINYSIFLRENNVLFTFNSDCTRCGHGRLHLHCEKSASDGVVWRCTNKRARTKYR